MYVFKGTRGARAMRHYQISKFPNFQMKITVYSGAH